MTILMKRTGGESTMRIVEFDYPVKQLIYKTVGDRNLILYVFEPENRGVNKPAILFLNGGSFHKGPLSPAQFQHQAKYFSSQGMIAICVDYRNGHDEGFTPIQAICDVKSAVRWVRKNSEELGIDQNKIVICGASAGGYIAVSSLMFQDIEDEFDSTDHTANALVIFAAGMDGVDIMERKCPALLDIAEELSPIHNVKLCLPPTLWMCGTADELFEQNKEFTKLMIEEGNNIVFKTYKDMEHGFFNYGRHENKYLHDTKIEIENFLKSLGYIV
jgi:acetyl esterase